MKGMVLSAQERRQASSVWREQNKTYSEMQVNVQDREHALPACP